MTWLQTYTGRRFDLLRPRPEDVSIVDIAQALSNQCRYAGHTRKFYSVAEHCVLLARWVPEHYALAALLHDAAEAYVVDVPAPLKGLIEGYRAIEWEVEKAIAKKFGITLPWPGIVTEADARILMDERAALMAAPPAQWAFEAVPLGVKIEGWEPTVARHHFLETFLTLHGDL